VFSVHSAPLSAIQENTISVQQMDSDLCKTLLCFPWIFSLYWRSFKKFIGGQKSRTIQKIYPFFVSTLIGYTLGFFLLVHIITGLTVTMFIELYPMVSCMCGSKFQRFYACHCACQRLGSLGRESLRLSFRKCLALFKGYCLTSGFPAGLFRLRTVDWVVTDNISIIFNSRSFCWEKNRGLSYFENFCFGNNALS
jgi:hypothetical protein